MTDRWTEVAADLAEFEAWCKGVGRGPMAGWHASALQMLDHFYQFKRKQEVNRRISEKLRQVEE